MYIIKNILKALGALISIIFGQTLLVVLAIYSKVLEAIPYIATIGFCAWLYLTYFQGVI